MPEGQEVRSKFIATMTGARLRASLSSDLLVSAVLVAVLVPILVLGIAVRVFRVPDRPSPITITTTVWPLPH
jgi:hypothetical protein